MWLIFNYSWPFIIYYTSKCTAVYCNETWGAGDFAAVAVFPKEADETTQSVVRKKEFVGQGSCVDVWFCHIQGREPFASLINLKWVKPSINSMPLNSWDKHRVFCSMGPLGYSTEFDIHQGWFKSHQQISEFTSPVSLLQCWYFASSGEALVQLPAILCCPGTLAGSNCGPWPETTAGASLRVKSYKEERESLLQS